MPIPIEREPFEYDAMASEHCAFCGQKTQYWHVAKDVAVCPPCAEDYTEEEVPTKEKWCDSPQGMGKMSIGNVPEDIFIGFYPTGLVYADKTKEVDGDYAMLGFLSFGTLKLEIEERATPEQARHIRNHAARIRAREGKEYQISQSGQTITLGHAIPKRGS